MQLSSHEQAQFCDSSGRLPRRAKLALLLEKECRFRAGVSVLNGATTGFWNQVRIGTAVL